MKVTGVNCMHVRMIQKFKFVLTTQVDLACTILLNLSFFRHPRRPTGVVFGRDAKAGLVHQSGYNKRPSRNRRRYITTICHACWTIASCPLIFSHTTQVSLGRFIRECTRSLMTQVLRGLRWPSKPSRSMIPRERRRAS